MAVPESADPLQTQPGQTEEDQEVQRHLHLVNEEPTAEAGETGAVSSGAVEGFSTATGNLVDTVAAVFTPDSGLYRQRQPSIEETLARAKHGRQLPEAGPARTAARAYGYAAAANRVLASTWCWVVDHPARAAIATVLIAVALAWSPTRIAAGWVLAPFSWAHTALV